LELRGSADRSVNSLFEDLEKVFSFLTQRLPEDLVVSISTTFLPKIIPKITRVWLDSVVPSSLQEMDQFQSVLAATKAFCSTLGALGFSNFKDLQEWTESAPKVWLSKRRADALDSVRTKLSHGK